MAFQPFFSSQGLKKYQEGGVYFLLIPCLSEHMHTHEQKFIFKAMFQYCKHPSPKSPIAIQTTLDI